MGVRQYQIFIAPDADEKLLRDAQRAVEAINRQAGFQVVSLVRERSKADAMVDLGNPRGDYGGYTQTGKRDRITLDKRLYAPGGSRAEYRVNLLAHEISHGLGLTHRGNRPTNLANPDIVGMNLTAQQRERLRYRYEKGRYGNRPVPEGRDHGHPGGEVVTRRGDDVVERRKVVIDYEINVPNAAAAITNNIVSPKVFMTMPPAWPDMDELTEEVRRRLLRKGRRNRDIFGGLA